LISNNEIGLFNAANALVNDLINQGYTDPSFTNLSPRYILLSRGINVVIFMNIASLLGGDAVQILHAVEQMAQTFGIDPSISPKHQGIAPWDPKA